MNRKSVEPYISDDLEYYPHQVDGIRRMVTMRSVLLADDMGLGKSLEAISLFAIDVKQGYAEKLLVVCPSSLKINWENEISKFTKNISTMVIKTTVSGISRDKKKEYLEKFKSATGPRVLITNYEQLPGMIEEYSSINWDMIIFDEAHMIKNPRAKRTKACHKLVTKRSILVTGSPVLSHVNDLWSLLERIAPGQIESYHRFVNRYAVWGGFKGKQIIGIKNEKELNARIAEVMVRRLKEDVLDLPEVTYTTRVVELVKSQVKLYKEVVENMQLTISDDEKEDIDNALVKYLRLKQICGSSSSIIEGKDDSGKLDAAEFDAMDLIVENGERVVAFTQFRSIQDAYVNRLQLLASKASGNKGPKFPIYVLNGDVPDTDRQAIVDQWSEGEPGIIVCMFQVAGVGLNMTAGRYGQFLDKLYTPSLNKQAVDRMHRIGADKTKPVTIIHYLARNTVEDRVEQILAEKTRVSNKLLDPDIATKLAIKQAMIEEKENARNR